MLPVRAGAGAGGSPKAALFVEVLIELFSENSGLALRCQTLSGAGALIAQSSGGLETLSL